ncbi:MAG: helix-hairpin-helix domain-containing protein [candidate division WOR-3 bacterium]
MNQKEKLAIIFLASMLALGIGVNYIKTAKIKQTNKILISLKDTLAESTPKDSSANSAYSSPEAASLININTATQKELEALPGIGPVIAQRIIEYRNQVGRFRAKEEILRVKGIGPKKYQAIKDKITI